MNNFCSKCGSILDVRTGECPNCAPQQRRPVQPAVNISPQIRRQPVNQRTSVNQKKPAYKKTIMMAVIAVVVAIAILFSLIIGILIGKNLNKLPESYDKIVEQYKLVMMGETAEDGTMLSEKLINRFKETEGYEICYSYVDINDNDTKELIVGGRTSEDEETEIYDVFTIDNIVNKDSDEVIRFFDVDSVNEDAKIEIYNEVIKYSEETEDTVRFEYLQLPKDDCELDKLEEYINEKDEYYQVIDGDQEEISEEDFEEADQKYEGEEFDLDWVKVVIEEDKKDKKETEAYATTLTDAQIASFEELLNDLTWSRVFYEPHESDREYNEIDKMIYTFIYIPDGNYIGGMYQHYFGEDYKQTTIPNGQNLSKVVYEFDADKVLFILNDIFGYNVTQSHTSEYTIMDNYKLKGYFKNNKFYVESHEFAVGDLLPDYEVVSYEPVGDGYFRIETRWINSYSEESGDDCYYIVKPAQHSKFGEYWKFKEYGKGNEVYWSKSGSNNTKPTETTTETTTEKPKSNDAEIYQEHLKNGGLNKYLGDHWNKIYTDIESCLIDLNNDGTSELLLVLTNKEYSGVAGYEVQSVLFGLQNGKVVALKEKYFTGGTAGGENLFVKYDSTKQKHTVVEQGHFKDGMFAGEGFVEAYSYNGKAITSYIKLKSQFYDSSSTIYADKVTEYNKKTTLYKIEDSRYWYYQIDEKFVSESQYESTKARFKDPTDSRYKMKKGTWNNPLAL